MQDPIFITTQSRLTATVAMAVEQAVRKALAPPRSPDIPVYKRWLTSAEAQAYLGLSRATLARYRAAGALPYSRVGSAVYYRLEDVEALLERGMQTGT